MYTELSLLFYKSCLRLEPKVSLVGADRTADAELASALCHLDAGVLLLLLRLDRAHLLIPSATPSITLGP